MLVKSCLLTIGGLFMDTTIKDEQLATQGGFC